MHAVLDASAILAILFEERGNEVALIEARGSVVAAVNMFEVYHKGLRGGIEPSAVDETLARLQLAMKPFEPDDARAAAEFKMRPAFKTVSLADCGCLAFASRRNLPVVTADRKWAELDLGLDIRLIR